MTAPKKLKTLDMLDEGINYFKNFLSNEENDNLISMLRGVVHEFSLGLSRSSVIFLQVKTANANSYASFRKATVDTQLHLKNSHLLTAPLSLFYLRGYATLDDFLNKNDPKIPENLAERQALKELLLFLSNNNENDIDGQGLLAVVADDTLFKELVPKIVLRAKLKQQLNVTEQQVRIIINQSVLIENKDKHTTESEVSLALRFVQHLLIPLVPHESFVIDPGLQSASCCPVKHKMNGAIGDTSLGCPNGWHGRADILLTGNEVPLTVVEPQQDDTVTLEDDTDTPEDDAVPVTPDSSIEKRKYLTTDSVSQVLAQTIVHSFIQQRKRPKPPCSLMPGIGICSEKLIVYLYDCVEDILLTTGPVDLFAIYKCLNYRAVVILWLVLNHRLFSNKTPDMYKSYTAAFHHVLGPALLETYRHQSQQPFQGKTEEEDIIRSLHGDLIPFEYPDVAKEKKTQFPDRQTVSLK